MQHGDRVLLWQAGRDAGLYAIGEITGASFERPYDPANPPAWVEGKAREGQPETAIPFRYTQILADPVPRDVFKSHPVLSRMAVIQNAIGTNFRVKSEEWQAIEDLLSEARPPHAG